MKGRGRRVAARRVSWTSRQRGRTRAGSRRRCSRRCARPTGAPMTVAEVAARPTCTASTPPQIAPTLQHLVAHRARSSRSSPARYIALRERNTRRAASRSTRAATASCSYAGRRRLRRGRATWPARCTATPWRCACTRGRRHGAARARSCDVIERAQHRRSSAASRSRARSASSSPTDRRIRGDVLRRPRELRRRRAPATSSSRASRATRRRASPAQGVVDRGPRPRGRDPGVDIEVVIREHGLRTAFPAEVEDGGARDPRGGRRDRDRAASDLRDLFTVTIDPVDATRLRRRDLARAAWTAGWRLGVHIADVSHYVPWGSVDRRGGAAARDVGLPRRPRAADAARAALQRHRARSSPDVDRFSLTVEIDLDRTGLVERYELFPASSAPTTGCDYDGVDALARRRTRAGPTTEARAAAQGVPRRAPTRIGKRRIGRGGLDFESVEPKVWLDDDGHAARGDAARADRRHEHDRGGDDRGQRGRRRAHARPRRADGLPHPRGPGPRRARAGRGRSSRSSTTRSRTCTARRRARSRRSSSSRTTGPEKLLINSLVLRALKRARYIDYLDSHFGLASEAYCHFTSPIRRYPDLIVHRLLRAQLTGALGKPPTVRHGRRSSSGSPSTARSWSARRSRPRTTRVQGQAVRADGRPHRRGVRRHHHRRDVASACSCSSTTRPRASCTSRR